MISTYMEIVIGTVIFIVFVSENISRSMTYATIASVAVVLLSFTLTACSNPGIVFQEGDPDLESAALPSSDRTIECTHCQMQRPHNARHCYHCATCVHEV
jgi:uncharacterized paraquat-inducible protein A